MLAPGDFDAYWRITLDFLKIAIAQWPAWLEEHGLVDRARRGALLIEDEIARLEAGAARGPMIIAGSTGTNRATARLIAAIARAPQGAVVLPDLDLALDEPSWRMIGGDGELIAGHPQAALHRLLANRRGARRGPPARRAVAPALRGRARFLSEALRPADSTDLWRDGARIACRRRLRSPASTIVEADDEIEEALALAIAMREALETPGKTAALISPDPAIARRVKAELRVGASRSRILPGEQLGQTGRAPSRGSSFARRSTGARSTFLLCSRIRSPAWPLAPGGRSRRARARARRVARRSLRRAAFPTSARCSRRRRRAARRSPRASRPPAIDGSRMGRRPRALFARCCWRRWRRLRAPSGTRRSAISSLRIGAAIAALATGARGRRARSRRGRRDPDRSSWTEWGAAASGGFACERHDYESRCSTRSPPRSARRAAARTSAPADPRPARGAAAVVRPRAGRRASTRRSGRRGRDRRLSQPADARRARPVRARAAHRPDRA